MIPQFYPVTCHTDHVGIGSTFVAIQGFNQDGTQFILQALERGAKKIVIQQDTVLSETILIACATHNATIIHVDNTRKALAELSAQALNYPAKKIKIIGITGTKGKTTTSFLLHHILATAGYKTALIGTAKNSILDTDLPMQLTTPQPDYLHLFLDACVQRGVEWVVMETAAQAFSMNRLDGILFDATIFTNFSNEHGEFYKTMNDYFAAKKMIYQHLKPHAVCFVNQDDQALLPLQRLPETRTFSCTQQATYYASECYNTTEKLACTVHTPSTHFSISTSAFLGMHNLYNMLAATCVADTIGISASIIQKAFSTFKGAPGRMERYSLHNNVTAIIDYAHNPLSYEALLSALQPLTKQLIVVFGAGGERDPLRRPHMGEIAQRYAQIVILTTDNPRSEDPVTIINDIQKGIPPGTQAHIITELDREKAIQKAYALAQPGALIALLGKGGENYQLIQGIKYPFSERTILQTFM